MADAEDLLSRVAAILRDDEMGVSPDHPISQETQLMNDLGFDSLDSVKIAIACEQEFNIHLDDDTIDTWQTVGDIVKSITEALGQ